MKKLSISTFLLIITLISTSCKKETSNPVNATKDSAVPSSIEDHYVNRKIEVSDPEGKVKLFVSIESPSESGLEAFVQSNTFSVKTDISETESPEQSSQTHQPEELPKNTEEIHIIIDSVQIYKTVTNYTLNIKGNSNNTTRTSATWFEVFNYFHSQNRCMEVRLVDFATCQNVVKWQTPSLLFDEPCGQRLWYNTLQTHAIFPAYTGLPSSTSYCLSWQDFRRMGECSRFAPRAVYYMSSDICNLCTVTYWNQPY